MMFRITIFLRTQRAEGRPCNKIIRLHRLPSRNDSTQKGKVLKINRKGFGLKPGIRSPSIDFGLCTLYEQTCWYQPDAGELRCFRANSGQACFRQAFCWSPGEFTRGRHWTGAAVSSLQKGRFFSRTHGMRNLPMRHPDCLTATFGFAISITQGARGHQADTEYQDQYDGNSLLHK